MSLKSTLCKIDPNYKYFGVLGDPIEQYNKVFIRCIHFETGELCFKQLYQSKNNGLYFKHKGYSPMYLKDFTDCGLHIPNQTIFDSYEIEKYHER